MSRYIDAEQIVYTWLIDNDGKEHDGVTLQSVIDMMPTADVVDVVRCKDCTHWENGRCYLLKDITVEVRDNDYCSYGEAKDD